MLLYVSRDGLLKYKEEMARRFPHAVDKYFHISKRLFVSVHS